MDDWDLLVQYREQASQEAFAQLVRRYAGLVYHACRRQLRDEHLAEDVSQAVFLLLARRGPGPSCPSLAAWLYRTAHFACRNAAKARSRRQRRERVAMTERSRPPAHPSSAADDAVADKVLASLGSADRAVLFMRFYEDRDLDHVGRRLGISENAAAKRLSRAILRARKILADNGFHVAAQSVAVTLIEPLRRGAPASALGAIGVGSPENVSPLVQIIIRRTTTMLKHTKAKLITVAAGAIVFGAGAWSVTTLLAQPPESKPAKAVAPAAATVPPKQVLKDFAAAVRKGDGEAMITLGNATNPDERQLMQYSAAYVSATKSFREAIKEEFDADAQKEISALLELTPIGRFALLIETTVDQAPEDIDGDVAHIQPQGIPDLTFWLVKKDGQWKLSTGRMTERWTHDEWQTRLQLIAVATEKLEEWANQIRDGKFATFAELKAEIAPVLRQNR